MELEHSTPTFDRDKTHPCFSFESFDTFDSLELRQNVSPIIYHRSVLLRYSFFSKINYTQLLIKFVIVSLNKSSKNQHFDTRSFKK